MKKLNYYILNESNNENEIGDIFKLSYNQIDNFIDPENNNEDRFDDYSSVWGNIDASLDLTKFSAMPQAKMTDLMRSRFFWHICFYSKRFAELYANFSIENSQLYPCKIHHNEKIYEYVLMSLEETMEIVTIDTSKFGIFNDLSGDFKMPFKEKLSKETYWDIFRAISEQSNEELILKPIMVMLHKPSDLFRLELDSKCYISERFRNAIEKANLTGFDFDEEAVKIEFYIED